MRKYFLLSVSCLLTSNVYAQNPVAAGSFAVTSYINTVDEIDCGSINLNFMINETGGNMSATISPTGELSNVTGHNVVYTMGTPAVCSISNSTFSNVENFAIMPMHFVYAPLVGDTLGDAQPTDDFTVSDFTYLISDGGKSVSIGGTLNFNNVNAGYYSGTFMLSYVY
ncbi:MAG: hypothetical protein E7016_07625 [Alphaproteobacteria bacterium]|nr:hypothetical protein [Alphaproteobacteria bacterium]